MTADGAANLLSWPAAFLAFVYATWTVKRWVQGVERAPHALTAVLVAIAAAGFLLRPVAALGVIEDGSRDVVALVIRTLFLVVMLGLVWNLVDRWSDRRRARRD